MSKVHIRRIETLTTRETDEIVSMLLRAYADNPAVPAMTGGRKELEDSLFRSMLRAGGLAGQLYVIEDQGGHILSMALWFQPGASLFNTEEQRELGFNDFISKLDDSTRNWWNTTYPEETNKFIASWLPTSLDDCWYLNILGTDPDHQRKGYATRLLNDAVQKADSPNILALCTTSQENADFYTKAGFPVRGYMDLPAAEHTFPIYGHYREKV